MVCKKLSKILELQALVAGIKGCHQQKLQIRKIKSRVVTFGSGKENKVKFDATQMRLAHLFNHQIKIVSLREET